MDEDLHLGHIGGVRVGLNWSLVIVFGLIAWSMAGGLLPREAPGRTAGAYALVGIAAAAVFLLCLLAHELAHSIVARKAGIEVEGIVLWLFGGVSRFGSEALTPQAELRISVVGPLTSLGLAVSFWVVTVVVGPGPSLLTVTTGWLGWINGVLALFNLLPAFPLDGGRVLRAALWRQAGDRHRATIRAGRIGEGFGWALAAAGLLEALAGDWLGGCGWSLSAGTCAASPGRRRPAAWTPACML